MKKVLCTNGYKPLMSKITKKKTKEETTNTNGETRTTELEFSNPVELEFLNPVANTCHTISRPINKATIGSP